MKTLPIFILGFLVLTLSCQKEEEPAPDKEVIAGISYGLHTQIVESNADVTVDINDSTVHFRKLESFYGDAETGNIFHLGFYDPENPLMGMVEFNLFLPQIAPEDFFRTGEFDVVALQLWHHYPGFEGYGDYYYDVKIKFRWDSVAFSDRQFHGTGAIILSEEIVSELDPACHFSAQTISFKIQ